jgi:cytochrome c-type biogenesis protein CcmH
MILWSILIALIVATVAALLLPLMRRPSKTPARIDYDIAIYRDQLKEIERDIARGVLDAKQAAAARTEIERRILAAAEIDENTEPADRNSVTDKHRQEAAIFLIAVLLPILAMLIYSFLGSPEMVHPV